MKKCSSCYGDNPDQAMFCSTCGQPLEAAPIAPQTPPSTDDGFTPMTQYPNNDTNQTYYSSSYSDMNQPTYPTANNYGTPLRDNKKGFAIASLCCGIFSVICCVSVGFGFIAGVLGLIFGILGLKSTTKRGLGLAGLIMSIFGILLGIVMLSLVISEMSDPAFWEEYKDVLEGMTGVQI